MRGLGKAIRGFNLKYILSEILLIFVGINLAIWFNNWNTSLRSQKNKAIVITRVKEEIKKNLRDLQAATEHNQHTAEAYIRYSRYFGNDPNEIIARPKQVQELKKMYPNFFQISDSTYIQDDLYRYRGEVYMKLELPELSSIAWDTALRLNIANELSYDCLYQLESMYNLQQKVVSGYNQLTNYLISEDNMEELLGGLDIVSQYGGALEEDYTKVLDEIDSCR